MQLNWTEVPFELKCSSASLKLARQPQWGKKPQLSLVGAEIANNIRVNLLVVKHVRTDLRRREMQNTSEAIFQWIKLNQRRKQVYWNININDKMGTTFLK